MTEMMQAVVFDGTLRVVAQPRPVPGPDEVLIRPRLTGICNTDLELVQGYKEFTGTLGHEFVGDVIGGPPEWIGQRVVGEINIECGACDYCERQMPTHCRQRRVLGILNWDGAFAGAFRLPVGNLWPVPEGVPDEVAVFTEPVAAACQVLEMARIRPSDRVVVIGAGKLGLLVAQVVRLVGADLSVIVRREAQADLLARWDIRAEERSAVDDGTADVVIDCTGKPAGFGESLAMVRPRGTIVLKSTYSGLPQADLTRIVVGEIRVVGSRCGSFDAALQLLAGELVEVAPLIAARYALAEAVRAFEQAAQPGTLKVLMEP